MRGEGYAVDFLVSRLLEAFGRLDLKHPALYPRRFNSASASLDCCIDAVHERCIRSCVRSSAARVLASMSTPLEIMRNARSAPWTLTSSTVANMASRRAKSVHSTLMCCVSHDVFSDDASKIYSGAAKIFLESVTCLRVPYLNQAEKKKHTINRQRVINTPS